VRLAGDTSNLLESSVAKRARATSALRLEQLRSRLDCLLAAGKKCLAKHYNFVMIAAFLEGPSGRGGPAVANEVDRPQPVVERAAAAFSI